MFKVIGCITEQHDLRFVAVAAALCLLACFTAMNTVARAREASGRYRMLWLAAAGVVTGAGIWGTHFVAMLAYDTGLPAAYDPALTALSIMIAVVVCGLGFALALRRGWAAAGGALAGAAIGAMHYVGMAAVRAPAIAVWDYRYVAASVLIGIGFSALATHVALQGKSMRAYTAGALLFALAIVGMHFTGMAAVSFWPDSSVVVPDAVLDPSSLAIAVAAMASLIVALGLGGAMLDHHLAWRASAEAARLRDYVTELELTKHRLETTSHGVSLALNAAAMANDSKSRFLAAMSHELRTPLNAVIGFSELLGSEMFGPLGHPKYNGYVEDIRSSGVHLLSLINDILDLSRLDAGELELAHEDVDLARVTAEALTIVRPRAQSANIRLFETIDAPDIAVRGDSRRIRQVLINLLGNAVKFTPDGGRVCVTIRRSGDQVVILVADTGVGMAKDDIPKAFERFRQVDSSLSRKYEGTGLGLPLARDLMEAHGGQLAIESALNAGTTVTMTFPRERVVQRREAAA